MAFPSFMGPPSELISVPPPKFGAGPPPSLIPPSSFGGDFPGPPPKFGSDGPSTFGAPPGPPPQFALAPPAIFDSAPPAQIETSLAFGGAKSSSFGGLNFGAGLGEGFGKAENPFSKLTESKEPEDEPKEEPTVIEDEDELYNPPLPPSFGSKTEGSNPFGSLAGSSNDAFSGRYIILLGAHNSKIFLK